MTPMGSPMASPVALDMPGPDWDICSGISKPPLLSV